MTGSADSVLAFAQPKAFRTIPLGYVDDDARLTWKAVGLLTYMLTRPAGWKLFRADLVKRHRDGKDGVKSGLRELRDCGYLRTHPLPGGGHRWIISQHPLTDDEWAAIVERSKAGGDPSEGGNPASGKPAHGEPGRITVQKPQQLGLEGVCAKVDPNGPYEQLPLFLQLWAVGRKSGKRPAFKAYVKAIRKLPHDDIVTAWRAYTRSLREGFEGLHLSTWLNEERWEDEQATTEPEMGTVEWLEQQAREIHA